MEVNKASANNVKLRNKSGRGEARPKSFLKSMFSRKSSKSGDDQGEDAKQRKRRIGSDRGATSGLLWTDNITPEAELMSEVSQNPIHPTRRRGMSIDASIGREDAGKPGTVHRNFSLYNSGISGCDLTADPTPSSTTGSRPLTETHMAPEPQQKPTDSSQTTTDPTRPIPPQRTKKKSNKSTNSDSSRQTTKGILKNGNQRQQSDDKCDSDISSKRSPKSTMVKLSLPQPGSGSPRISPKASFSVDVLSAVGQGVERVTSMFMEFGDEAFCIDGWQDDEDSLDDFSGDENGIKTNEEAEDEVDGPSHSTAQSSGLDVTDGYRLRTIDESKAIPKYQRVAMEILTTESTYVKRLSVLESLRRKLEDDSVLSNEVLNGIFVNLPSLLTFHKETLLPRLQQRIAKWEKIPCIGDVMKEYAPHLKMYTPFVKNIDNARKTMQNLRKQTPKVSVLMSEIEKSSDSGRIALVDFLTEPMTRLLRYKLLLGEYLRKLPEEHMDRKQTEEALDNISEIATYVNESIKAEDNLTKTLQIMESLQSEIDLIQPHRTFLKEGRIAMVNRAKSRHMETHIYLFSDILLVCQPPLMGVKYKIHKQLPVAGLKVEREDDNHFIITSRNAVLEFYGSTQREAQEWETAFRGAVNKFKEKHKPPPDVVDLELDVEEELGYRAPLLARRDTASQCNQCMLGFVSLRRPKNHCHACGQLFCPRCSNRSIPLAYDNWRSRRVCDRCFSSLQYDAVCRSIEDLSLEDWKYGELMPREQHFSDL